VYFIKPCQITTYGKASFLHFHQGNRFSQNFPKRNFEPSACEFEHKNEWQRKKSSLAKIRWTGETLRLTVGYDLWQGGLQGQRQAASLSF
jgi:hypothetical protein